MERPRIPILPTIADILLEVVGIVFIVLSLVYIAMHYQNLPSEIPVHFNFAGEANNFGSKNNLLLLPAIGIGIFIGMTVLSKYPYIFNYPVEVTRRNVIRQYRLATRLIRWIKLETAVLFGLIVFETVQVANGQTVFVPGFIFFFLGMIFLTVIIYLVKAARAG